MSKRRNDIADTLKGLGKPEAADATPKRRAEEGPNGGPKISTSTPEAPLSVCHKDLEWVGGKET